MIEMVSDVTGEPKDKINLRTSINNDLSIHGDDVDLILERLHKDFDCELEGLYFYDYFMDESEISGMAPIVLILLPVRILGFLAIYPFDKKLAKRIWNISPYDRHPDLTVADLVTSVVEKKWAHRQTRRFKLI